MAVHVMRCTRLPLQLLAGTVGELSLRKLDGELSLRKLDGGGDFEWPKLNWTVGRRIGQMEYRLGLGGGRMGGRKEEEVFDLNLGDM